MITETPRMLAAVQGALIGTLNGVEADCEVVLFLRDRSAYQRLGLAVADALGVPADSQVSAFGHESTRLAVNPDAAAYWPCVTIHLIEQGESDAHEDH